MKKDMKQTTDGIRLFSIIIPFQRWNGDLDECLTHIGRQSFGGYEIILLPDSSEQLPQRFSHLPITIIPTGHVSPSIKRDRGADIAVGSYLAFIDDDAYPTPDWLHVAHEYLTAHPNVGAVGGPAMTPKTDPLWARVSGAVFLSPLSGGFPERYVPRPPERIVDDWPSVNLIVRRSVFFEAGGYDSAFWPGEDTKLCRDIIAKGHTIVYLPEMLVHHHRRARLQKHLRQVGNYGFHRGYFARKYPENSRKLKYFVPSLFVSFLLIGTVGSVFSSTIAVLFAAGLALYGVALLKALWDIQGYEPMHVALLSLPYILLTHFWYGTRFIQGVCADNYHGSLGR